MSLPTAIGSSRRQFLKQAGLVISFSFLPMGAARALSRDDSVAEGSDRALNAFVVVSPDNTVTVISKHIEFGQGPYTGLATIVAEEMNADWSQIRVESSPADDEIYGNTFLGRQITGGSSSIANSWEQLRKAGATARAMLVAAAAQRWKVPAEEVTVSQGRVLHKGSGQSDSFGELATLAAEMDMPKNPSLKSPKDFSLIGKDRPRVDTESKTNGQALFTQDIHLENMLYAMVAHPSQYGAKVKSFNEQAAKQVNGVVDVKRVSQGVAVYAENTYAALKGRAGLDIEWDSSDAETRSSEELMDDFRGFFDKPGLEAVNKGDVSQAMKQEGTTLHETEFVFPFLAHAPMETLDAVFVRRDNGSIDCYAGAQAPTSDKKAIAEVCEVDPESVFVHVQLAGGSFGRRAQQDSAFMRETAEVFKASGMKRPLKFLWTREDDIRGGYYRPMYIHRLKAATDADGKIVAWDQVVVGQSIRGKIDDIDDSSVEGASDMPYTIANHRMVSHNIEGVGIPPLWWRSVGHTHTGFTIEVFLDELLEKTHTDPIEGRLALLKNNPRERGVLQRVAEMAKSAGPAPKGCARGVAVHKSFKTYVAQIAEVSQQDDGTPKVERVFVAVDCGIAVNPNIIAAQMEGGVGFGLGAVLFDEITLGANGHIQQSNFHDYRSLRIEEMPLVEVSVISSDADPTGVGEPGVPPVGPAVVNAWRRLTGQAIHQLPMVKSRRVSKENISKENSQAGSNQTESSPAGSSV